MLDGSANILEISISQQEGQGEFGIYVGLANKLKPSTTISLLKNSPCYQRSVEDTQKLVKSKFSQSSDVACDTDSIQVSLKCPVSYSRIVSLDHLNLSMLLFQITSMRLELPALGKNCGHITCFSALTFVELNQSKPEWHCPICKMQIGMDDLRVDL